MLLIACASALAVALFVARGGWQLNSSDNTVRDVQLRLPEYLYGYSSKY